MDLNQDPTQKFDILNYLNDLYMAKMAPQIDLQHAGGFHNIHANDEDNEKEILEKNKKHIDIPNARIQYFSLGSQQNIKDDNEPQDHIITDDNTDESGKGYNDVPDETSKNRRSGRSYIKEIIDLKD